jgi:hypothetical protein
MQQPTGMILRHRFRNHGSEIFTGSMSSQDILGLPGKIRVCMVLMSENCFETDAQKLVIFKWAIPVAFSIQVRDK